MITLRRPAIILTLALFIAACGGGTASSSAPTDTGASQGPSSQAPSSEAPGATPTEGAAETPAPSQDGGGSTAADACALVTADEAGSALGATGEVVGMNTPGDVSFCIYNDGAGDANLASSWMKRGGSGSFAIWKAGAGVQEIDGLGDDAVWDPSSATLLVLKGDAIFTVSAGDSETDEAQRLDWSKAIAEIAVGRM
jgi:hypothetical protein